ncbi:MAG: thioredoxin family protein [Bacteroidetes bacterium]|nr:thioredoxin family protein [Bacteroidota bacterium]
MRTFSLLSIATIAVLMAFAFKGDKTLSVGDVAPDFTLKNVDGKKVSLSDYNDKKGVILVFTCNHCPFAIKWEDRIIELDKNYAKKDWPVVAINPNDPEVVPNDGPEEMKKRAKEKGFTFPYLFDEGQKIFPKYGATKTPHVFLLKRYKKEFKVEYIGAIDDNYQDASKVTTKYVENAIEDLEAGKKPRLTEAKAIGCSIKVKQQD